MEADEDSSSGAHDISSNIALDQLDEDTAARLRGDAIGNTMYSEVFVLNTLLQFSDLKWSKEVEDNLCFLWDTTEETDVCQYLFQINYPSLACSAIIKYEEPRFIEIVVGIFANLLCSKCKKEVKVEDVKIVLNLLHSDDPYVLIQVMRFIHAVSFMFDKLVFIEPEHIDRFEFILENSANKELLAASLKAISTITDSMKLKENVMKGEMLVAVVTAYKGLKTPDCETELLEEQHIAAKYLIQFMCNLCCYVDGRKDTLFDKIKSNMEEFTNEIVILLNFYKSVDNLESDDGKFKYYIEALTYIYRVLKVGYIAPVAQVLYELYVILCQQDSNNLELVAELLCYFISVGDPETVKKDYELVPLINTVLSDIKDRRYSFEFEYKENLRRFIDAV